MIYCAIKYHALGLAVTLLVITLLFQVELQEPHRVEICLQRYRYKDVTQTPYFTVWRHAVARPVAGPNSARRFLVGICEKQGVRNTSSNHLGAGTAHSRGHRGDLTEHFTIRGRR
ncbi:PREDICTED: uncharacterized protein LOC105565087 isoform X2 [Vollenhovia emeryi]|uniref:uncharacterized protein LOC105565087 isoform X2 n=1 Tax=Vollenhovia emeryi TaxID=411798 RepID=UPI0005F3DD92|nr:PREDICTED: uncharacterized protein LOC105565087 isoform X2 [Vollenhovia emeryi]